MTCMQNQTVPPSPIKVTFQADSVSSTPTTLEAFVETKTLSPPLATLSSFSGLPEIIAIVARAKTAILPSGPQNGVHLTVRFASPLNQANANGKVSVALWQADMTIPSDEVLPVVGMPPGQLPDS